MVREEIIDESSDEDNMEYWKAKADEMLQRDGWGDEDSEDGEDPFLKIESDSESDEDSMPELIDRVVPSICYSSSSSEEEDTMPELVSRGIKETKKTN